jgi:hypothetical protein
MVQIELMTPAISRIVSGQGTCDFVMSAKPCKRECGGVPTCYLEASPSFMVATPDFDIHPIFFGSTFDDFEWFKVN